MSNSQTSLQTGKTKKIICLIRPTDDVDTNIKQALKDFIAKAKPHANASVFYPEVAPAIVSSLGSNHLMITSPDFHNRNCFPLCILQDFMNMHRVDYVFTRYLHRLDRSDTERSNKDLLSRLWLVSLLGVSSKEVKLCLQTFRMDFDFRKTSTAQGLTINEYNNAAALRDNIAAANSQNFP